MDDLVSLLYLFVRISGMVVRVWSSISVFVTTHFAYTIRRCESHGVHGSSNDKSGLSIIGVA